MNNRLQTSYTNIPHKSITAKPVYKNLFTISKTSLLIMLKNLYPHHKISGKKSLRPQQKNQQNLARKMPITKQNQSVTRARLGGGGEVKQRPIAVSGARRPLFSCYWLGIGALSIAMKRHRFEYAHCGDQSPARVGVRIEPDRPYRLRAILTPGT